ncbi:MAG: hypothetical protein CL663_06145 [Bacteroidetes bacterium]|nr:hypothetical protein [Bacteroidota bacterium]
MKKLSFSLSLILAFLVVTTSIFAGDKNISAKEFSSLRKANKKLIVVDARKATDYAKRHVMKAINIPYADLNKEGPVAGILKDANELAAYFAKKGISNDSKIVIYDDGSSKYNSRVYWALKYAGATDVSLLHRDMNKWKIARIPMTASKTMVKKGNFVAKANTSILAEMEAVHAASKNGSAILVDVRDVSEYNGTSERSDGHIPGAINIPYTEFLKANGSFKINEEIKALSDKAGLKPEKEIIVYCASSVRASVAYFALTNILGFKNVKAYDGAYNEWISVSGNPISK